MVGPVDAGCAENSTSSRIQHTPQGNQGFPIIRIEYDFSWHSYGNSYAASWGPNYHLYKRYKKGANGLEDVGDGKRSTLVLRCSPTMYG